MVNNKTPELADRLAQHRTIGSAPPGELAWLIAHGELRHLSRGEVITRTSEMMENLLIVLSGHFAISVDRGAGPRKVMEWRGGDVSGLLPYSRMKKPVGHSIVDEPGDVLAIHRDQFPEMIRECPVVTAKLVHVMLDRARVFTESDLRDEKMLSLGRMAAGLAHELNNPAAAAARSAKLLKDSLFAADTASRALGTARLTDSQLAAIDQVRNICAAQTPPPPGPLERADREEMIASWLEDHGADPEAAAALVDTAITIDALDKLASVLDRDVLNLALRWMAAGCASRMLASEVERAAGRIRDLVGAVKRSSYMDRAVAAEPIDLAQTLNDSVVLLQHKARKKSVSINLKIDPNLPNVLAIGGDLNSVWTNLIDNALDAVPESGRIDITADRSLDSVVVRIIDNGPGIPSELREQIFDRFFTTKPIGEGTGLGLSIARQLARRNSGDIEVESSPGRTEFRVTLPVTDLR